MQVQGPANVHGPQPINAPHRAHAPRSTELPAAAAEVDQLDISPEADMVSRAREIPDVRTDRVQQIRQAIESGEYDTDEKLDLALDRLLDELEG